MESWMGTAAATNRANGNQYIRTASEGARFRCVVHVRLAGHNGAHD